MKWKLTTAAGVDIFVHWTFLLLPVWIVGSYALGGAGLGTIAFALAMTLSIFGCVVLHELGHALAARRYGIETEDITLLPIGGLARLTRMPRDPWQEFVIAAAGPLVNLAIATLLGGMLLLGSLVVPTGISSFSGRFLTTLLYANIGLVLFNLLPSFPMDGGRILRAGLSAGVGHARATHLAVRVGQIIAGVFMVLGLLYHLPLALVGLFVWLAASAELASVNERERLPVGSQSPVPTRPYPVPVLPADARLVDIGRVLFLPQEAYYVASGIFVVGRVTKQQLLAALAAGGGQMKVSELVGMST